MRNTRIDALRPGRKCVSQSTSANSSRIRHAWNYNYAGDRFEFQKVRDKLVIKSSIRHIVYEED